MKRVFSGLLVAAALVAFGGSAVAAPKKGAAKPVRSQFYIMGAHVVDGMVLRPEYSLLEAKGKVRFDPLSVIAPRSMMPFLMATSKQRTFK